MGEGVEVMLSLSPPSARRIGLLLAISLSPFSDAWAQTRPLRITEALAMSREIRYRPDGEDFVIVNGDRRFNRALYGGPGPGRIEAGDQPRFSFYLPGKGGTLRVGISTEDGGIWAHEAEHIEARYRPGEMLYEIRDPSLQDSSLHLRLLASDDRDGLLLETRLDGSKREVDLIFAYGAANGQRFSRGGDIGADPLDAFDLKPEQCTDQIFELEGERFVLKSEGRRPFRMVGTFAPGSELVLADANALKSPVALLSSKPGDRVLLAARTRLAAREPNYLGISSSDEAPESPDAIRARFMRMAELAEKDRSRIKLNTPDPYLNTIGAAIGSASDGVWDPPSYVHGAVAWPARLNGWRGAYVADALGFTERAREHIRYYANLQLLEPPDGPIEPDPEMNLARQTKNPGTRLYSRGYIASSDKKARNHYDMNLVFIDMLLRHLKWTGDKDFAEELWPTLVRHLEWEKRCFDSDNDGLYDAFACIWASDALQYTGGSVTLSSAYNYFHNQMAARIASWLGKDPEPYLTEADRILAAMNEHLWLPESGHFAEYIDFLGGVHSSAALWTFYHTIDSEVPTPQQAHAMARWADRHFAHIPVPNPNDPSKPFHVLPTSNWHPYVWSINNVAMAEITHGALAYWQAGRPDKAFHIWKGTVLDNLYFGSSPGNFQQLSYLDAYRGELYRDFADTVGINARAIVEGLMGFVPDAIAGHYLLRPGFPSEWDHAGFQTPTLSYDFRRSDGKDRYVIDSQVELALHAEIPARTRSAAKVTVNGNEVATEFVEEVDGFPLLRFEAPAADRHEILIQWTGDAVPSPESASPDAMAYQRPELGPMVRDWNFVLPESTSFETVAMDKLFNDRVSEIFKFGKYLEPRPKVVTLQLPTQGIGDWPAFGEMHEINDQGLRRKAREAGGIRSPQGIPFATPAGKDDPNILFTSRWENYPETAGIPLTGQASRIFLLMAGSTNPMQSRIDNGEVLVTYTDGSSDRLALRNPDSWWPIDRNYFEDDYAFRIDTPFPPRLHLESGKFEKVEDFLGKGIHGGAATLLGLQANPEKELSTLTLRTLTNDVVIGLMAITLERP